MKMLLLYGRTFSFTDGKVHEDWRHAQAVRESRNGALERGAGAVELVDKRDARDVVPLRKNIIII